MVEDFQALSHTYYAKIYIENNLSRSVYFEWYSLVILLLGYVCELVQTLQFLTEYQTNSKQAYRKYFKIHKDEEAFVSQP